MEIHQLLAGFRAGDAIGNYALELQSIFKELGYKSHIYAIDEHICAKSKALSFSHLKHREVSQKTNILIYHFSLGSQATDYFINTPDKKILIYHNITPAKFFRSLDNQTANFLSQGRKELNQLASYANLALGVSEYNRQELEEAKFKNTAVIPLILSQAYLETEPSKKILKLKNKEKIFLSVGRIAPNKKIEDIIKFFYFYKKTIDSQAKLFIVGGFERMGKYYRYLKSLLIELDLIDVTFAGHVSLKDLLAYYSISDAFICMSEHEGFCIPLLEAMYFKIPVFAFSACAIPETLENSGIIIYEKKFRQVAELVNNILSHDTLKEKIIKKQSQRVKNFNRETLKQKLIAILENFS